MSKQIEIEFKNMLTKDEFHTLVQHFGVQKTDFHTQKNHYFDTPSAQLKALHAGLRIRQLHSHNELTLKEPSHSMALLETTDILTNEQVENILLNKDTFPSLEVVERLQNLNISVQDLTLLGTLSTTRAEINYKDGLLVFDQSHYANKEDFELEYEVNDEEIGKIHFLSLLEELNIPVRLAEKKLARFMHALKKEE